MHFALGGALSPHGKVAVDDDGGFLRIRTARFELRVRVPIGLDERGVLGDFSHLFGVLVGGGQDVWVCVLVGNLWSP